MVLLVFENTSQNTTRDFANGFIAASKIYKLFEYLYILSGIEFSGSKWKNQFLAKLWKYRPRKKKLA
jgi:hypothetical protein